jgi:hypothetical protein
MRVAKENVDVRMEIPGVVVRQTLNFGSVRGFDEISGEYFTLAAGVDTRRCSLGSTATSVSVHTGASC